MKKVLILVNHDVVIYNFRKELVQQLLDDNYKVYISSPYGKRIDYLVDMGCEYIETEIDRHGMSIFKDYKLISKYKKLIKKIKPSIVLGYTIKPNIYGGIACKSLSIPFIATITGLGTAMEKKGLIKNVLIWLYKFSFKRVRAVFFQNQSNQKFFVQHKIATGKHKIVPGSGVNINEFRLEKYPSKRDEIKILFIGRIMKEKGIEELTEAAKIIKKRCKNVVFDAIGFYEQDYTARAKELEKSNVIKFHGAQENVKKFIKDCNIVILPSYHEGMANVLLEASAMGRPVIASKIPGCQETFDESLTGFGIVPKDVESIVNGIQKFVDLPHEDKEKMGYLARRKVEREFDRNKVVAEYIKEIKMAEI